MRTELLISSHIQNPNLTSNRKPIANQFLHALQEHAAGKKCQWNGIQGESRVEAEHKLFSALDAQSLKISIPFHYAIAPASPAAPRRI